MNIIEQDRQKWEAYSSRIEIGREGVHVNRDIGAKTLRIWAGSGVTGASIYLSIEDAKLLAEMLVQAANKE